MTVPQITPLPPAPSRREPATFSTKADAHVASLPGFVAEANALAVFVDGRATDADDRATEATAQAGIATAQAGIATTQAGIATAQAGIATTQAGIATAQAGIATAKAGEAAADRVQTGLDRTAAGASAASAAMSSAAAGTASGRLEVASFPELATVYGYSAAGGRRMVAAGDMIRVVGIGATYRVAADTATDAHLDYTGTGGVRLYVLPGSDGAYHTAAFGQNWRRAFEVANALATTGLSSTIFHPGATVVMDAGGYTFDGAGPIDVLCNVEDRGAEVNVPAGYNGIVWRIGKITDGAMLATASITMPNTNKPTGTSPLVGTAYRVVNANACCIKFGRADWFDKAYHMGGIGQGTVYCDIYYGQTSYANIIEFIAPGPGGWFNANNIFGGNFRLGGFREPGKRFVSINGLFPATAVVGNSWYGTSYEALGAEYTFDLKGAYGNTWNGIYIEHGLYSNLFVTVSGSTLTRSNHGLTVGDLICFTASTLPGEMLDSTPYWVVATPTSDTFSVSRSRGGAVVTFSTSGSNVQYFQNSRMLFDGAAGSLVINNVIKGRFSPPSHFVDIIETGQASGNVEQGANTAVYDTFASNDAPLLLGRNKSFSATSRPVFAAYPPSVDPRSAPTFWASALSDRGLLFGASGAEAGRLWQSAGTLQWQPAGQVTAQVPTGFRSSSLTTLGTTVVPANGRAITTITVTGAAVGDYVVPYIQSALPDGIAIAWARVSSANTVQFAFHNWTGSAIDIAGAQLKAMVIRSFF